MIKFDRPTATVAIDLRLFPLPVVQAAAYALLPESEFDFALSQNDCMEVTICPFAAAGSGAAEAAEQFRRELTATALQRKAHQDHHAIRVLFAAAAHAPAIPQDELVGSLRETICTPEESEAELVNGARCWITERTGEGNTYHYCIDPECKWETVLRALSRLHDTASFVLDSHTKRGLGFTVTLPAGTPVSQWEERLVHLLVLCREGGLPAIYPPVHSLEESYIRPAEAQRNGHLTTARR